MVGQVESSWLTFHFDTVRQELGGHVVEALECSEFYPELNSLFGSKKVSLLYKLGN